MMNKAITTIPMAHQPKNLMTVASRQTSHQAVEVLSIADSDYADLCDEIAKKYEMDDGYDDDYGDNDYYDDEELENMECIEKNK